MYSQNNEEKIILDYFGPDYQGSILDIGANDGITLSNSLACIERGWIAFLLEPAKVPFRKLFERHLSNLNVFCLNYGIGTKDERVKFYSSGWHLNQNDTDLLSTFKESELKRWGGTKNEFTESEAELKTFESFIKQFKSIKDLKFDVISIDVEGMDYEVLTQIDLKKYACKMLIVETNSVDDKKYIDYAVSFGMKLHHKNHENLIFVKA